MKIFSWLADRSGCGYYRIILPGTELANLGHDVWLDDAIAPGAEEGDFDVIVGQRICLPGPSATWQKLARDGHTKLVFETDDLLDDVDPANKAAHRFFTGETTKRYVDNMRVADLVTVTTDALAERCSKYNPNVTVLPNMIPKWLLTHEREVNQHRTVIGWRGGPSHSRDFGELAAPLRRFLQHPRHRDTHEFHAMGADYTERVRTPHARTRHTLWLDTVDEFLGTVDFDVAVIPLHPSAFNDCKSDLALLEMSALGIPSIVTPTGPYSPYTAGRPYAPVRYDAATPDGWTNALIQLTIGPDAAEDRAYVGAEARKWASTRTIEANGWRWADAYAND